jgi:Glyoxalase-like domain
MATKNTSIPGALPIDHLVINVQDEMDQAQHIFGQLGFTLTPRGRHTMGSINHLMMFDEDYIELIGLPKEEKELRPELLVNPVGIDGLVFQTRHAEQTHAALLARQLALLPVQSFSRPVELDGRMQDARFKTVRLTPGQFPAGRVYFCQHFTPELVWRKEWQTHKNGAYRIAALLVVSAQPEQDARQYCLVSGGQVTQGQNGEFRIAGKDYALVFITQEAYETCYGPLVCQGHGRASYFGAIALKTHNLDAVRETLNHADPESNIRWREMDGRISLDVPGFNTILEFVETDLF